jgi:hypothetical protein
MDVATFVRAVFDMAVKGWPLLAAIVGVDLIAAGWMQRGR